MDNNFTKEIRERYEQLPTLFELTHDLPHGSTYINIVIAKLERKQAHKATAEEFDSDVCALNCLTYFYLSQDQLAKAESSVTAALIKEPCSVTALANKCELHLHRYEFEAASRVAEALDRQKGNKAAVATALAEQGYCLSRLGPVTQFKAIDKYSQAIEMGHGHCPPDKLVSWKYGLALNLDRVFEIDILRENPDFDKNEHFQQAVEALAHVVHTDNRFFKAKAFAVLGQITKKFFNHRNVTDFESARIVEVGDEALTVSECFERACALAPQDRWVLERAGKHWRHMRQYDRALELLHKAYALCPSSFSLHHLGLTYRTLADQTHARTLDAPTAGYGRGFRGQRHPWRPANAAGRGQDLFVTDEPMTQLCDVSADFAALSITSGEDGQPECTLRVRRPLFPSRRPRGGRQPFCSSGRMRGRSHYCPGGAAQNPENTQARGHRRGRGKSLFNCYREVKDPHVTELLDQAIKYIREGIELSKDTGPHLLVTLAEIYVSLGKTEESDDCFRRSMKTGKYVSQLFCARTFENWGLNMQERGDQQRSEQLLRLAIESAAKVKSTRKVALDSLIEQLKESQGQTPQMLRSRSKLYELVGLHGQALSALWEADTIQPQDPDTLLGLVKNLAFRKQYDEALMYWAFLRSTECGDHLIDSDLLESIYFGAAETHTATLSLSSQSMWEAYEVLLMDRSRDKRMYIFHRMDSNEDTMLAENIQQLAKEVADVEFVTYSEMPAGKLYNDLLKKATEKYNAIIVLVTPDFVADKLSTSLCSLLKQCVLLCLHPESISIDQIPPALRDCHHALLAKELYKDFTTNTDPIQKLHMWREIFNNLRKAKQMVNPSKQ